MTKRDYKRIIGQLIQDARQNRQMTQAELAKAVGTSQSAINRIENGKQNLSIEMIGKLSTVLKVELLSFSGKGVVNFRIHGGRRLKGSVKINTSKNAAVALLCGALINRGKTTLRNIAKIEEVYRIIEVIESLGVRTRWLNNKSDLEITPPAQLDLENLNLDAARRTRSVIMLMGALANRYPKFKLPYVGGCNLGQRTIQPHLRALSHFGVEVNTTQGFYFVKTKKIATKNQRIVLSERGDTVTENALFAAASFDGVTRICNASPNYMVQDVCFYLEKLGIKIDGIGTTNLTVYGKPHIDEKVEYYVSEDPIEAMSFIAAAVVTDSEVTVKRAPIEFLEIELEVLRSMNLKFDVSDEYLSRNQRTRLVDITIKRSKLIAASDKIHPMPFPGLNIDNLPFFAVIAAVAEGQTMIHDWVYENRAVYLTELAKLNVQVQMVDLHRVYITGPANFKPAEVVTPPALRPAVVIMLCMLAAEGESILRNIYSIARGYEDFARRLNALGANIETIY